MRYNELNLVDLPAGGAVAIIGENESGKTTIGEAIAFALFGETVKTRATDISQVVSWDAEEAEVGIEIDAGQKGVFRIERRVDKRGGHDAALYRLGAPASGGGAAGEGESPAEELVARGPEDVADQFRETTGLTFDEFRHSFYLAQAELGLVRRANEGGDGRRVVQEIVGIGALSRAAAEARAALALARRGVDALGREHGVARAIADAHRVDPGYGAELEQAAGETETVKVECERRLPEATATVARLKEAEAARGDALEAFERLSRAVIFTRAARAGAGARADLDAIGRGLEGEANRLRRDLQHREKTLAEVRSRVDRLIEYQAKMAELEARIDLYKLEVKRSLDAPEIQPEDIGELEHLALPATPAAGLKVSEARVVRLRGARRKAILRAITFFAIAVIFGLAGAPAVWRMSPRAAAPETGSIVQMIERGVALVAASGSSREHAIWLGLAVGGSGLALVFLVLGISRVRRAVRRGDQVKLAEDAVARLRTDVAELQAERARLEGLDLKRPLKFAEAVKELRNQTVKDQFEKIRELHNDFISSPEQRGALVAKERAEEARLREEAQAIEARLARVTRLAKSLPGESAAGRGPAAGGESGASEGSEEAIPERLEVVEARVKSLLDRLEEAERDRREIERGGGPPGEPIALFRAVKDPVERLFRAAGTAESARASFVAESRLHKLAADPGELGGLDLRQALAREAQLLEETLPRAQNLRSERERAEEEVKAVESRQATAVARLSGLASRLAEVRERRARFEEAERKAAQLEGDLATASREAELAELTADMLEETAEDLRRRVGPMLSRYAAAVLPRLTGGRYRRVKVLPDLELRAYSPEKNDFVPLVDLSIGAADQLLLSLRLAVGRALVTAKGVEKEKHFLFLDEPMASFDEHRAKAFLEILGEHRDIFPQVFVVAHLHIHGLESMFVRVVTPELGSRTLDLAAPPAAAAAAPDAPVPAGAVGGDDLLDVASDVVESEPAEAEASEAS